MAVTSESNNQLLMVVDATSEETAGEEAQLEEKGRKEFDGGGCRPVCYSTVVTGGGGPTEDVKGTDCHSDAIVEPAVRNEGGVTKVVTGAEKSRYLSKRASSS